MATVTSAKFGSPNKNNKVVINLDYSYTTNSTGRYYTYTLSLKLTDGYFNWDRNPNGSKFYVSWLPGTEAAGNLYINGRDEGEGSLWGTTTFSQQVNFGNAFSVSAYAKYLSGGTSQTLTFSEAAESPWQVHVDYVRTNGCRGWIKGPESLFKYPYQLHFYVNGILAGTTEANIYRSDIGESRGFDFVKDLYEVTGKEGTFEFAIWAILTTSPDNHLAFLDEVTVTKTKNPVVLTSISAGNDSLGWGDTYEVLSDTSGKVTGDSLSDLKYRVQINKGGYSEEFERRVKFDGSYYTLHELSSAGDNYLFETDSGMATDSILNYLQKDLLVFPITVETSINVASTGQDIVNTYNLNIPTIIDFNKLYEEEVYRSAYRIDDGTDNTGSTYIKFAIKYPKSYNLTLTEVKPDKVTINNIDYTETFTVDNLGDNLLRFNTIIPTSILGEEDRGTFFTEFSDNISSVQISFKLPAMYDNNIVIGRKKVGIPAVDVNYTSTSKTDIAINSFDDATTDSISLFNGYGREIPRNVTSPCNNSYYNTASIDYKVISGVLENQEHIVSASGTEIERVALSDACTNKGAEAAPYNSYVTALVPYQEDYEPQYYIVITNNYGTGPYKPVVIPNGITMDELDTFFKNASYNYLPYSAASTLFTGSEYVTVTEKVLTQYVAHFKTSVPDSLDEVLTLTLMSTSSFSTYASVPNYAGTGSTDISTNFSLIYQSVPVSFPDPASSVVGNTIITKAYSEGDSVVSKAVTTVMTDKTVKIYTDLVTSEAIELVCDIYQTDLNNNNVGNTRVYHIKQVVSNPSELKFEVGALLSIGDYDIGAWVDEVEYKCDTVTAYDWDIICYPIDTNNVHKFWLYSPTDGGGRAALPYMEISGIMTHEREVIAKYRVASNDYYNNDLPNIKFMQVLDSDLEEINKGDLIATSTSGIAEVHYQFNEPAEESDSIYCQCKEFIEGDEIGFAPPAKVLAKEFIEEPEDNNVYIGKNKTQFNELIEI